MYRTHQPVQAALHDALGHVTGLRGGLEVQVPGSAVQTELERAHVFELPFRKRCDLPPPIPGIPPPWYARRMSTPDFSPKGLYEVVSCTINVV